MARPGARTATEALVLGCPLIFNVMGGTMPQEQLARRYFRARQLESVIKSPSDLAPVLQAWRADPLSYQQLRARMRQERLQSNPEEILSGLLYV
ncbi:hypothetical protein [Synechococcus sp. UW140]|uniref:hypothetical protein n=1 Tax=Synechococcus sp. UW140 TaxID=368503 RepID=UPI0025DBD15A|nr:hypothetical protein [Synechococcus sp. UW140]